MGQQAVAFKIKEEGSPLIRRAAVREPAKIIHLYTGAKPKTVANWREGQNEPQWHYFLALAQQCPDLRQFVARWLNLTDATESQDMLRQIKRMVEQMPEAGDRV